MNSRVLGAMCAFVLTLVTATTNADSVLDFGIKAPTVGTLSYAGGAAPLQGAGIDVDDIVGLGTPSNDNILSKCLFCVLDFTTGGSTGGWNFGAGGTITIIGGVDLSFDGTQEIANGSTLLSGTFYSAKVVDLGSGSFEFQIVGGSFTDTKHPELLAFYGLPEVNYIGGLNISFSTSANPDEAFTSTQIFSGDIVNQPVPVPAAVWLFGSGLLGLVGIARRKKA
jgi:hypothetical protein